MQEQIEHYERKLAFEMDPYELFEAYEKGTEFVAIDTRKEFGFEREHIPGAINLPHRQMNEGTTEHLDRSKIYVCYCDGIGCNAATKGALKMTKLGFKAQELIGGIEWWKFDGYATNGVKATSGAVAECAC